LNHRSILAHFPPRNENLITGARIAGL
jgi:hypothetical protein